MSSLDWVKDELAALRGDDLLRELPAALARQGPVVEVAGRRLVNFASNDYLGLAADERLIAAAVEACRDEGVGRGAAPLVCGRSRAHVELEERLAAFEGTEAALLFPSGFAANAGTIPALVERGDAIFADAKNHASLIDGCRLARAETHVYAHRDMGELARLLGAQPQARRKLVVTDTLFSMDGDVAPLAEIAGLAQRYGAMLLIDEAHATGVFGERGRGIAESCGVAHDDPSLVRVGTLSKALSSAGGFVAGSRDLIQWLANRARTYVFSTAQPAAASAAACVALELVASEPWRRTELLATAARVRAQLREQGWEIGDSASQIIPILAGSPGRALELAARLREQGYWVPAIRPPSVPAGESLLRLSLTAGHSGEMVAGLLDVFRRLAPGH